MVVCVGGFKGFGSSRCVKGDVEDIGGSDWRLGSVEIFFVINYFCEG